MSRVKKETIAKLHEFFDTLPTEARSKCALCNETLTHIVKTAEVETGAGTATVTRELANRINDGAAPGDQVSGEALRQRLVKHPGKRPVLGPMDQINPKQKSATSAGLSILVTASIARIDVIKRPRKSRSAPRPTSSAPLPPASYPASVRMTRRRFRSLSRSWIGSLSRSTTLATTRPWRTVPRGWNHILKKNPSPCPLISQIAMAGNSRWLKLIPSSSV